MGGTAGRASMLEVVKTVAAGFAGVRRRDAHERAAARIRPWQLIVVAVAGVALLVATLVTIVRLIAG